MTEDINNIQDEDNTYKPIVYTAKEYMFSSYIICENLTSSLSTACLKLEDRESVTFLQYKKKIDEIRQDMLLDLKRFSYEQYQKENSKTNS